ncbi:TRAP transporter substrate-binding protein [Martelella radicis]|uniref:TRAP-type C4-dicarboxylate transport system substrate-binding protein n=1 Tax=Martelella radicis TaxID=1397476 RepID=A0A7W6KGW6_9HYPH|nr:TRAP transporter substrate-binding protein [Martelella radicis]MBB4121049.1 TRAP-type C4-dicarboxylate transport system substrate-binding protein [Martelella radicis]
MKTMLKSATVLAGALFMSQAASAETLTVANWLPPSHPLVADVIAPFAASISEATDGRVTANILPAPLGPPPAQYDLAVNSVADITFGVQGYNPGRFRTTNIAEIPFWGDTAEETSVAYWRTWDSLLKEAGEYDDVHVLAVFTHGPGQVFMKGGDLSELSTIDGAKIRVGGGIVHELVSALGGVPVEGPSSQTYELLSQGVADGITFPYESVNFFGLTDLVDQAMVIPGGLYNTSFFVVMNKDTWEGLSAEDQAAIDSVSGEALARLAGKAWDAADAAGFEAMQGKVTFHDATPEQVDEISQKVAPVVEAKLAEVDAAGIPSDKAVAMMKENIEALQTE